MILNKEELIALLNKHDIPSFRYAIQEYNDSLVRHNAEWYTPKFDMYHDSWGNDNLSEDEINERLVNKLINRFKYVSDFIYLILSRNGTINLGGYFSIAVEDKRVKRMIKINNLLIKTKSK